MATQLITAPATEPVTRAELQAHLRLDTDDTSENHLLDALITAARQWAEDFQNRRYITQTYDLWLDDFPDEDYIRIPLPPLVSITSIKYYDTDDVEATFTSSYYFVDTKSEPGRVGLNYGEIWPTTTLRPINGVAVRFVAGYGEAAAVPTKVKQSIKLICGHWYENRENTSTIEIKEVPLAAHALLWQDRIVSF